MSTPGKKSERIDSINVLLEECILAYPVSSFVISLYKQYQTRGSLSKKQLQGLYAKASDITGLAPGKLAAVEAIINRMPTRNKFAPPAAKPLYEKDAATEEMIITLLRTYPLHKGALLLKSKFDNHEQLSASEKEDLKRWIRMLKLS